MGEKLRILSVVATLISSAPALLLASGCDAGPPDDAGVFAGMDSGDGRQDSGPILDAGCPTDADFIGALSPIDYGCLGTVTAPSEASAQITFDGTLTDNSSGDPVEGLTVQLFPDDNPSADGSCGGTCAQSISDSNGVVSLGDAESSWYAYRVVAASGMTAAGAQDYVEVLRYHEVAPAPGGAASLSAIQSRTRAMFDPHISEHVEPGTAVLLGRVEDCSGNPVPNTTVRLFAGATEIILGFSPVGPRAFYFNGDGSPSGPQRVTHVDGLYGAVNVPAPLDGRVRVEIWGTLCGETTMLGCEEVRLVPNGVTSVDVGPTRSDGPDACSG